MTTDERLDRIEEATKAVKGMFDLVTCKSTLSRYNSDYAALVKICNSFGDKPKPLEFFATDYEGLLRRIVGAWNKGYPVSDAIRDAALILEAEK